MSRSALFSTGRMTFIAGAANATTGAPAPNIAVTFSVKTSPFYTVTCRALTAANGVAICRSGNGNLVFVRVGQTITVKTAATVDYRAATTTAVFVR